MGYELSIRRTVDNRISLAEWEAFLNQDGAFSKNSIYGDDEINFTMSSSLYVLAFWQINEHEVPFAFYEGRGEISVKNPDQFIVDKMIEMAAFFEAVVVGEEGEVYAKEFPKGKFLEPEKKEVKKEPKTSKLKWWQLGKKKASAVNDSSKELIGARFYYEDTHKSYNALLTFLKRLQACNEVHIEKSHYHVMDYGLAGTIKDIERNGSFQVGVMIETKIGAEHIMITSFKQTLSVSFCIHKDLNKLNKLIDLIQNDQQLLFGSVFNEYDNRWQSETSIRTYKSNQKSLRGLKFRKDIFDHKCVDVSSHPGRRISGLGLGFVAGYKNYFGPKMRVRLSANFWENPIFLHAEFEDQVLITQLFEHPLMGDFTKEMRHKQKSLLEITNIVAVMERLNSSEQPNDFEW